ncbi:beta-1,4-N-acetylgalactosaminyltransferase 3 isoform X1 [Sebastes umbrosus]|uniref:beta-1,4-N-acetylgalactosaminyltransferase 3 isoform X1 n=1 Tax=Sebastes umbrosus TaxID=72105 RepID=UPI00189E01CA|nr:beta-1,4-N-acetylgalactosaminyltransferase 3 isoform X1 [Sebastes umbrosus]
MFAAFFPVKKLRRHSKHLVFGLIVLLGLAAVYHEMVTATAWSSDASMNTDVNGSSWWRDMFDQGVRKDHQADSVEDSGSVGNSDAWRSSYTPQTWKPEYKGQANLHGFEDWCGGSTADLYRNPHYPLYPHSRTTVQKLAVYPHWTNYGLRIFGYLHPYTDGEFVFAMSSGDNSELWLSTDDSPLNVQLLAWVGKTGAEWSAPHEFEKYASQVSKPVWLSAQRKYFFEVIHKQDDRGTDHVEVAWQLLDEGLMFKVIDNTHISLYVNESALLMGDTAHIPQTAASHQQTLTKQQNADADMLREDPRDALYHVPLINSKFLQGVLPDCSYKPIYTIKDFPVGRYQGLQFVHLSFIYPNDYTRLTHMETENSCFYPESVKRLGFSKYMKLESPDMKNTKNDEKFADEPYKREKKAKPAQVDNKLFQDYGDDYDDYAKRNRRKLFSLVMQETNNMLKNTSDTTMHVDESQGKFPKPPPEPQKPAERLQSSQTSIHHPALQQNRKESKLEGRVKKAEQIKPKRKLRPAKKQKLKSVETAVRPNPLKPVDSEQLKAKEGPAIPSQQLNSKQHRRQRYRKMNQTQIQRLKDSKLQPLERDAALPDKAEEQRFVIREMERQLPTTKRFIPAQRDLDQLGDRLNQWDIDARHRRNKVIKMKMPLQGLETNDKLDKSDTKVEDQEGKEDEVYNQAESWRDTKINSLWGKEGDYDQDFDGGPYDDEPALVFDTEVKWSQTFQVSHLDLQAQRTDRINLGCGVLGNLLLHSRDALPIVKAFMDQLYEKHPGQFTLVRVINVVKRSDGIHGSRYFLELELKDVNSQLVRLSHYIYTLTRQSKQSIEDFNNQNLKPQLVLCNPVGFRWNPAATVHFIVPVKNQARWVQQMIANMEHLFRETKDTNFNLIMIDYNSSDMDVRKALQKSSLPRYEYVKLSGNFERSAGLQAGVDLLTDSHSIVFLCDLHLHFPPAIIDTIRKNCVEGYMAFAPIVMRLECGATPLDARGNWEVNGFGLLGIYKSDLVAVGGMNTREYKDRWGGEDWELLDRILKGGLEVERIYMRNFFHYFHSKRGMWNRRMKPSHR